jgi:N-acylglucosamine-6-phosphate 2-epimerase
MENAGDRKRKLLDSLKGGLIVSCQVNPEDPVYLDGIAARFAAAAEWAGAAGIRANSPGQIREIKAAVGLPVIGIYKIHTPGSDVIITPTPEAAVEIHEAGADIIALDCTGRMINGRPAYASLPVIKRLLPEAILFADISTYGEAARAIDLGADIVAPTLYGYTAETAHDPLPNLKDFARMCRDFAGRACVFMEGRVNTPEDARHCLGLGAHAVVVGSAITRPHFIAKRFADGMRGFI